MKIPSFNLNISFYKFDISNLWSKKNASCCTHQVSKFFSHNKVIYKDQSERKLGPDECVNIIFIFLDSTPHPFHDGVYLKRIDSMTQQCRQNLHPYPFWNFDMVMSSSQLFMYQKLWGRQKYPYFFNYPSPAQVDILSTLLYHGVYSFKKDSMMEWLWPTN